MEKAEIGLIGLGTMGSNLALNIAEKGHRIAVFNRTAARTDAFMAGAGALAGRIVPCHSLAGLAAAIRPPRPVVIMVVAGNPVDQQIAALREVLSAGDIVIDAGNANFHDTVRRFKELEGSGLAFIGMGVSGGEEGARHGPSIMVGGAEDSWRRVGGVLTAIAARFKGEPCAAWLGPDGAGHFVKTIHNGIEYADMQMIAEIYGVLRDGLDMGAKEIAPVFSGWNEGRLNSYLIEITATVLAADDPATGRPVVDMILDRAGQKGTGKWSAIEAQQLGVPATAIEAAVAARALSFMKDERLAAGKVYGTGTGAISEPREELLKELELALLAGKIPVAGRTATVVPAAGAGTPLPQDPAGDSSGPEPPRKRASSSGRSSRRAPSRPGPTIRCGSGWARTRPPALRRMAYSPSSPAWGSCMSCTTRTKVSRATSVSATPRSSPRSSKVA